MNTIERNKVRRVRTLQAILRGYQLMNQPVNVDGLCYRFKVPAAFSYRGLAGAITPKRRRWQPRRGRVTYIIQIFPKTQEPVEDFSLVTMSYIFDENFTKDPL